MMVLRTSEPALRFYHRLHARGLDEIEVMRLDGEPLHNLATLSVLGQDAGASDSKR